MPLAEAQGVMALLARFEAEAARDEARVLAREFAADAARADALRLENEILDGEWREAQRLVTGRPMPEAAPVAERVETAETRTDPVGLILDGLPDAILAEFQGHREQVRAVTVEVVLDAIPEALVASYRADRERLAA